VIFFENSEMLVFPNVKSHSMAIGTCSACYRYVYRVLYIRVARSVYTCSACYRYV
jgi:hypothetical protein